MQNQQYIRTKLQELLDLLYTAEDSSFEFKIAKLMEEMLDMGEEQGLIEFGNSLNIWGGSGSLFDQGFINDQQRSYVLYTLFVEIGEYYINNRKDYIGAVEVCVMASQNIIKRRNSLEQDINQNL